MPLISMKPILAAARRAGYGVGAFNIVDYNSARAVVQSAEQLHAPVIVQTSVKTVKFWGASAIASWLRQLAANSPAPVALHLDHCSKLEVIEPCIAAGWTSVMIDASDRPFEENLALTQRVLEMAAPADVGVEAELGEIGGVEDDKKVSEADAHLVDPEKALVFCRLPLAVFAPAIGTAHGIYKSAPKIAFDRLEVLFRQTSMPFALHGGTGLSDEVFQRCIKLGCAKVNISTQLKHSFIDSFVDYHLAKKEYEPLKPLGAQFERMKQEVIENIKKFGGDGRGEDFKFHLEGPRP
jgi:fructose-bisphosphate aldolase class II/tagatose 1,6-diphosphate aldolase GatY/KbaY